jgi:hypothetical protein
MRAIDADRFHFAGHNADLAFVGSEGKNVDA